MAEIKIISRRLRYLGRGTCFHLFLSSKKTSLTATNRLYGKLTIRKGIAVLFSYHGEGSLGSFYVFSDRNLRVQDKLKGYHLYTDLTLC